MVGQVAVVQEITLLAIVLLELEHRDKETMAELVVM